MTISSEEMWAIKITKGGSIGRRHYLKDQYWAGRNLNSTRLLRYSKLYVDKDTAQRVLDKIQRVTASVKGPPYFKIIPLVLMEKK